MGTLLYGNPGIVISFEDRALMHLQIVITAKLRRSESFVFSWTDAADVGSGRSSIWLDPSSTLLYRYFGSRIPSINREWIETLTVSANSGSGLIFTAEPGTPPPPKVTRAEHTRAEHGRTEPPRADRARTEHTREHVRTEYPRTEYPRTELPRTELPRAGLTTRREQRPST
jgi:hypothetical protein